MGLDYVMALPFLLPIGNTQLQKRTGLSAVCAGFSQTHIGSKDAAARNAQTRSAVV